MDSIAHSETTKPACGEGQRRVRTSAAAIGLAISMGAATMALSKPSNASVAPEPSNETRKAPNKSQPDAKTIEPPTQPELDAVSDTTAEDLTSALMVPSIDKTAVIPEENAVPEPLVSESAQPNNAAVALSTSPATPQSRQHTLQHTVRDQQTLWQIASAYQVSVDSIAQANGIFADTALSVGQVLDIPVQAGMNQRPSFDVVADSSEFTANRKALEKAIDVRGFSREDQEPKGTESLSAEATTQQTTHDSGNVAYVAPLLEDASPDTGYGLSASASDRGSQDTQESIAAASVSLQTLSSRVVPGLDHLAPQADVAAFVPSVLSTQAPTISVHHVIPGETLYSVANRHGVTLDDLIEANNLADPDRLLPGQELRLPSTPEPVYSVAAVPSSVVTSETGVIAPTTPRVAAPASRIAAVSRRDQSLEQLNRPAAATSTIAPSAVTPSVTPNTVTSQETEVSITTTPSIAAITPEVAIETQAVDYADSLRGDIERLRSQSAIATVADSSEVTTQTAIAPEAPETPETLEVAAIPTLSEFNRSSAPSITPSSTRDVSSPRVNPEFSARDDVRNAASAASITDPVVDQPAAQTVVPNSSNETVQASATSGITVTPSPAPLVASRDTSNVTDSADALAVAPLGASNYAPVLPPRSVSPDVPALAAVGEYLPDAETPMGEFNGYVWPAQGVLTSGYGWRWGRMHNGIDIGGPTGTPIVASAPGVVTYARWNSGGYGNLVEVTHPDGSLTLYAHNNRILVEEGEQVDQGQHIADMGSTGFSTGPHLHFELHSAGNGVVNPVAYLR